VTYARGAEVIDRTAKKDAIERSMIRMDVASLRVDQERYAEAEMELRTALAMEEEFRAGSLPCARHSAHLALVYRDTARYAGEGRDFQASG